MLFTKRYVLRFVIKTERASAFCTQKAADSKGERPEKLKLHPFILVPRILGTTSRTAFWKQR